MKNRHKTTPSLKRRFNGLLPIVIDVETSGLQAATHALLEIAMVQLGMNEEGKLFPLQTTAYHVEPFLGSVLEPHALAINGIDPFHPLRFAIPEKQMLCRVFERVHMQLAETHCYRAVLVGHNAWFDLSFILAATRRTNLRRIPLHTFTVLDTASLAAVALGETVLARAVRRARISFNIAEAHSAIYDVERTAELFCYIVNNTNRLF